MICAGGMSYEEAAEALQCSVGTVKSRLWRARRQMEELIMGKSSSEQAEERPATVKREKVQIEHRAQ